MQALKNVPAQQLPQTAWDFAAGRAVGENTRVLAFERQTLVVEVPDANWRAQLQAMAPQFLARLNPLIRLEYIEFKLAGPLPADRAASAAAYQPARPPRGV